MKLFKTLMAGALALTMFSALADCHFETKMFKGKATKIGNSFVASMAYDDAAAKAESKGYVCSEQYHYWLSTGLLNSNKYTAKVEVECRRYVCDQPIPNF
jgi:hypothetical protein